MELVGPPVVRQKQTGFGHELNSQETVERSVCSGSFKPVFQAITIPVCFPGLFILFKTVTVNFLVTSLATIDQNPFNTVQRTVKLPT